MVGDSLSKLILTLGLALAVFGIWWGWVECWNPDQMALQRVIGHGLMPLEPLTQLKPPFHTYLNFLVSLLPVKTLERTVEYLTGQEHDWGTAALYISRALQVALFIGLLVVSYATVKRASGLPAARATAMLLATSAGLVVQAHFLTADVPVTFWMILGFWLAQGILYNPTIRQYVLAGVVVGLATATKYNGLAAGLAIPIFHVFAHWRAPLVHLALDRRLVVGVLMVLVGFLLGNPYSVIKFQTFAGDFVYNLITTPRYSGEDPGASSFGLVPRHVADIVGIPTAIVALLSVTLGLAKWRSLGSDERATVVAAIGVVGLYVLFFGRSPRLEVRFVLPIVPLILIAAAPAWRLCYAIAPKAVTGLAVLLGIYGTLASAWVGYRFATDPRMQAQVWVAATIPSGSTIESTKYTPNWNLYPGIDLKTTVMPSISGRARLFAQVFAQEPEVLNSLRDKESDEDIGWFSVSALDRRQPEYVAVHSLYTDRFMLSTKEAELYPEMRAFFGDLEKGRAGYEVVFKRRSVPSPWWLYPREIQFVDGEMIILRKTRS